MRDRYGVDPELDEDSSSSESEDEDAEVDLHYWYIHVECYHYELGSGHYLSEGGGWKIFPDFYLKVK